MEDETIIDLYFAREERAISETGKKYGSYCRSIAFNILHSHEDTEECVSDTYLHTWNTIPPTRPGCLRAFLGRITRNLSFTRWEAARAQKRGGGQTELLLSELSDCLPGGERPEAQLDAQAVTLTIEAYLRTQTRELQVRHSIDAKPDQNPDNCGQKNQRPLLLHCIDQITEPDPNFCVFRIH